MEAPNLLASPQPVNATEIKIKAKILFIKSLVISAGYLSGDSLSCSRFNSSRLYFILGWRQVGISPGTSHLATMGKLPNCRGPKVGSKIIIAGTNQFRFNPVCCYTSRPACRFCNWSNTADSGDISNCLLVSTVRTISGIRGNVQVNFDFKGCD